MTTTRDDQPDPTMTKDVMDIYQQAHARGAKFVDEDEDDSEVLPPEPGKPETPA